MNQAQLDLLQWVADGSPDGVYEGFDHHVSAAALRRRGLVRTTGHGERWKVVLTDAGRNYLAGSKEASAEPPRQANVSVTQQLVDDVIGAGGVLRVKRRRWYGEDGVDWENRALLAERYGKVPAGKRLEVSAVSDAELEVRLLEDPSNPGRADLVEVQVPEKVGRYHPAARRFRDDTDRHQVSRAQLQRAVRIAHALVTEAERRGWTVPSPAGSEDEERSAGGGGLAVVAGGRRFWLHFSEKGVKERGRWEEEVEQYRNAYRYWSSRDGGREYPNGPYDAGATGELKVHLGAERAWVFRGHQSNWGDRASWQLEERLGHVFREMEERIVKADRVEEEERIEAERRAEEERREVEERERQ